MREFTMFDVQRELANRNFAAASVLGNKQKVDFIAGVLSLSPRRLLRRPRLLLIFLCWDINNKITKPVKMYNIKFKLPHKSLVSFEF